jgi:response regulator RpfG family c-di-GMP phosphodiesterase
VERRRMNDIDIDKDEIKAIMLVEDEEAHAAMICRIFEEDSPKWSIHHVTSIGEAFKWLEQNKESPPRLVISDYRLPDGTGLDLVKDAKSPEEVGFPLIILTGVGSEKLAIQSIRSGAMDYVVKGGEELGQLPRTAVHVIREWDLILERKESEDELKNFINDLEKSNSNLEEFMDSISGELEGSLSSIQNLSKLLMEKYADKLDDTALDYLKSVMTATEKANHLLDSLIEYLIPIYFDSSLIRLYNAKLRRKNRKDQEVTAKKSD